MRVTIFGATRSPGFFIVKHDLFNATCAKTFEGAKVNEKALKLFACCTVGRSILEASCGGFEKNSRKMGVTFQAKNEDSIS